MFNFIKKWFKSEDRKMIEEYEYQQRLSEIGQSDAQISRAVRTIEHLKCAHGFSGEKKEQFEQALEKVVGELKDRDIKGDTAYKLVTGIYKAYKESYV